MKKKRINLMKTALQNFKMTSKELKEFHMNLFNKIYITRFNEKYEKKDMISRQPGIFHNIFS